MFKTLAIATTATMAVETHSPIPVPVSDIGGLTTIEYNEMLFGIPYGVAESLGTTELGACASGVYVDLNMAWDGVQQILQKDKVDVEAGL